MRIKFGHPLLVKTIAHHCGGSLSMSCHASCLQAVTHLSTDSREVERGDLFVALHGEHEDGHSYIPSALSRGASVILCEAGIPVTAAPCCYITVQNTGEALAALAEGYAAGIRHQTIAVTGSVGKTTTRHYLACVLSRAFHVHESAENYNNLLGTSLTLLSMPQNTDYLVAECGMDGPGQISRMSCLLKPDKAVITNIGLSHMEKLGSGRAIAEAKLEITHGMSGGTLFIEANDPYLPSLAPAGAVTVSATHVGAMCRATHTVCDEYGVTFDYIGPGGVYRDLRIPSLGLHTLSCALFAIAIAEACGMKEEPIRAGLLRYTPVPLRQNLLHFGKIGVLLDAYNACPASMRAACASMELIAHASGGKMIAVLGDMLELGGESDSNHRAIGEHFARRGLHALFLIGDYAPLYAAGAMEGGMKSSAIRMYPADTPPAVIALAVAELLAPHDVLLIKGSRKLHLEELIPPLEKALIS